ncbi:MAG: GHMP kinase [Gammaproteobacteria bacterium]|nr:GHMP kinase [Gammaproteobacteria bacterium]
MTSPTHHTRITVVAPARLHLGFVDLHGGLGRRFGSIGLTVSELDVTVRAEAAQGVEVFGVERARAAAAADAVHTWLGDFTGVRLTIERAPSAHAGLGSGTQLALAVATACSRVAGRAIDPRALAPVVRRGERSGIGIAAFESGGFLVDGGRGSRDRVAPLLARLTFPEAWRVLLIFDDQRQGLHGEAEVNAFARLPPMGESTAAELARWCLVGLLPAVADADFTAFARAIDAIQTRIGQYFAPVQGSAAFSSPRVAAAIASLREEFAVAGVGQSSWGPTGFVFAPTAALAHAMQRYLDTRVPAAPGLRCLVVAGQNTGATILAEAGERLQAGPTPRPGG